MVCGRRRKEINVVGLKVVWWGRC